MCVYIKRLLEQEARPGMFKQKLKMAYKTTGSYRFNHSTKI